MQRGPTGKVSSLSFHVGGAQSQMLAMLFAFGNTHKANQMARKEPDMTFEDLPLFRSSDPTTSRDGAKHVMIRRTGQLAKLLLCYADSQIGMTDEEAGIRTGMASIGTGYWKRCSDLRRLGLIEYTGTTRLTSAGTPAMVCTVTAYGIAEAHRLRQEAQ